MIRVRRRLKRRRRRRNSKRNKLLRLSQWIDLIVAGKRRVEAKT